MKNRSKRKGSDFERELVNQAIESGLVAERAYASNGRSLGEAEDVDVMAGGKRIQAKRSKNYPSMKAIDGYLTDTVDAVAVRADGCETRVVLTWWEYLDLITVWQQYHAERGDAGPTR